MTPKDKAEALYDRVFIKVNKSNPLEDMGKTTKRICQLMVTEIMISKMIDLTDEQVVFWRQVQDEIENV